MAYKELDNLSPFQMLIVFFVLEFDTGFSHR